MSITACSRNSMPETFCSSILHTSGAQRRESPDLRDFPRTRARRYWSMFTMCSIQTKYPLDWLREGRAWNEQYVLRAFLQFNRDFRINLFGDSRSRTSMRTGSASTCPCMKNTGGAIWLERVR